MKATLALRKTGTAVSTVVLSLGMTLAPAFGQQSLTQGQSAPQAVIKKQATENKQVYNEQTAPVVESAINPDNLPVDAPLGASTAPSQVIIHASPYIAQNQDNEQETTVDQNNEVDNELALDASQGRTTQAELLRRARVRQELQNEDLLQRRLEELRLDDERKRTDQILTPSDQTAVDDIEGEVEVEEVVVTPAPTALVVGAVPAGTSAVEVKGDAQSSDDSEIIFSATPKAGAGNMFDTDGFIVNPRFAAGVELGMGFTDHVALTLGYQYSSYGVEMASGNPYVRQLQILNNAFNQNFDTLQMNQNTFDVGMKVNVLSSDFRIQPFFGVGTGYTKSFINYDDRIQNELRRIGAPANTTDYEVDQWIGTVTAGLDVKITKNIAIGGMFKYHHVLASRQNQDLYGAAFGGPLAYRGGLNRGRGFGMRPPYYGVSNDQAFAGGSLQNSNYWTATVGTTFSF